MRKHRLPGAVLAAIMCATPALSQVGVGTPDCHTQGTLFRMANHCPPEAIAKARQEGWDDVPRPNYGGHPHRHAYDHRRHHLHTSDQ